MKLLLSFAFLFLLVSRTLTQDGFDLGDALGDPDPTPAKPKEQPKDKPSSGGGLDLGDALGPDKTPTEKPKKTGSDGFDGFDLSDALKPDPEPKPTTKKPPHSGGGGGSFDDSDLMEVADGNYKPDGGRSGGRAQDPGYDANGGADQPPGADPVWLQILEMLKANMPEELYARLASIKRSLEPLLQRAAELLQAVP